MTAATRPKTVDEIKAELEALRARKQAEVQAKDRRGWYGLVYLHTDGYCSITDFENGEPKLICLGRSIEFIPYLRAQGIDGNNIAEVLAALKKYQLEQKVSHRISTNHHQNPISPPRRIKGATKTEVPDQQHPRDSLHSCHQKISPRMPLRASKTDYYEGRRKGK